MNVGHEILLEIQVKSAWLKFKVDLPGGHRRDSDSDGNVPFSNINDRLNQNEPVIVGVYPSWGGTHFLVLKKVDGDDWTAYDPLLGPDIKFSEHYSKSSIFSAEVIY